MRKNFTKKVLSIFIVVCMMLSIMPMVFADSDDLRSALDELNGLSSTEKGQVLAALFDATVEEIGNNSAVTAEDIFETVEQYLSDVGGEDIWSKIVVDSSTPGDGKISTDSVMKTVEKIYNNKSVVIDYYDEFGTYLDKGEIKILLGLSTSATAGQVFNKLISKTKAVVTKNSDNEFVAYGDVESKIATALTTDIDIQNAIKEYNINEDFDKYLNKVNNNMDKYDISINDMISVMNIFGLYHAPSTGGGGVKVTPTPESTASPEPTASPTPTNVGQTLQKIKEAAKAALDNIEKAATVDEAKEVVKEAITSIVNDAVENNVKGNTSKVIEKLAEKVIEKAGKQVVTPKEEGKRATAVIDNDKAQELISKIDKVKEVQKEIQDKVNESGIKKAVESKLTIDVPVSEDIKEVSVVLPANVLNAAAEKGIDKIEVASSVAKISVPTESLKSNEDETVSIEVKALTKDDNTLTEAQKTAIPDDAVVLDFSIIKTNTKTGEKTQISKFGKDAKGTDKKAKVTVPYKLKSGDDPKKLTVFYVDDKGNLKNKKAKYDEETGSITFETEHFSKYIIKNNVVTFADVAQGFWGKDYIESMAAKGIINGKSADSFDPQGDVTRAEFAKLVATAIGLTIEESTSDFTDVAEDAWYAKYVAAASNAGIVNGYTDGTFKPNEKITREQMAVMIARALGEDVPANVANFTDFDDKADISDYALESIAIAVRAELMNGKDGNKIDPKGYATRAESATVIYRLFNY